MCLYFDILGSGEVLLIQLVSVIAIVASIILWLWIYVRSSVPLRGYAIPIILWIIFGSLDVLLTVRGTIASPMVEYNPLTRFLLENFGYAGGPIAVILWIALWASFVFAINRVARKDVAVYVSLTTFYALAAGHLLGFSSWFAPLCQLSTIFSFESITLRVAALVLVGGVLSAIHILMKKIIGNA